VTQEATLSAVEEKGADASPRSGRRGLSLPARPDAFVSLLILIAAVAIAAFAPWVSPHDPNIQKLDLALKPPIFMQGALPAHLLGTDGLGRDLLSIIFYGFRVSLTVGIFAILIAAVLGVALGVWSGYMGGRVDTVIMRLADFQLSLPVVLVALAVISISGPGVGKLIVLIGLVRWTIYGRTVRGSVLSAKEQDFVEAARAVGARPLVVIFRHILPGVLTPILIISAVELPRVMLLESTLSFLGLGVPPTVPSLGSAIAHGYGFLLSGYWWLTVLPGFALMIVVICINLLGDWLRDVFDPRMQN